MNTLYFIVEKHTMRITMLYFIFLAIFAGILVPIQSAMNASLSKSLGGVISSGTLVFFFSFCVMVILSIITRATFPTKEEILSVPAPMWLGGILGVCYILLVIYLTPRIGVGLSTVLIVLGQVAMSIAMDHFAVLEVPEQPISWLRACGVLLLIAGVTLIKMF